LPIGFIYTDIPSYDLNVEPIYWLVGWFITGVKLMTVAVITVIPRWRTWNQVKKKIVD
jgi:hypothetical protein